MGNTYNVIGIVKVERKGQWRSSNNVGIANYVQLGKKTNIEWGA